MPPTDSDIKKHDTPKNQLIGLANEVFIIGAGVGGCFTALELAVVKSPDGTPKYKIKLAEKAIEVLRGSSNVTPGRMGLGFHYVHKPTAFMYLKATIEFQKKYSKIKDFRIGSEEKNPAIQQALQRGRYFITKDSKPGKEEILATYKAIQAEYARLVAEDPSNKVFGAPEDFLRILDSKEYQDYVHMENVDIGIETPECLLGWPEFRKYIITELESHENIEIMRNTIINKIEIDNKNLKYKVEFTNTNDIHHKPQTYVTDVVVNCTWENIRALNATAGLVKPVADKRTNRLKAIIIVKLPDSLRDINSAFFCMGPHAMFSNLGNGHGAMTYAPVTSMFNSTDLVVPNVINKYLNGEATLQERMRIAERIREGVAKYVKGMETAEIVEVRFGIVQTNGEVDIFDHKSEFSRRDYNGVSVEQLGLVSNACMKLLYGPENGEMCKEITEEHQQELAAARKFYASLDKFSTSKDSANKVGKTVVGNLLQYGIHRPKMREQIKTFDRATLKPIPLEQKHTSITCQSSVFQESVVSQPKQRAGKQEQPSSNSSLQPKNSKFSESKNSTTKMNSKHGSQREPASTKVKDTNANNLAHHGIHQKPIYKNRSSARHPIASKSHLHQQPTIHALKK